MKLKINELAVIYYNLETPNRYDVKRKADKEKARKNFKNSLNFDADILEKAFEVYLLEIKKDFEVLMKKSKPKE
jgi:hypothetical protein